MQCALMQKTPMQCTLMHLHSYRLQQSEERLILGYKVKSEVGPIQQSDDNPIQSSA